MEILSLGIAVMALLLIGAFLLGDSYGRRSERKKFIEKKPWTSGKFIYSGHAVHVVGYDGLYLDVLTWGSTHKGSWSWWDDSVDECYAILPPEAKEPNFAPGFDFVKLQDDLAEVAIL